jgi:hypothetical protein
MTNYKDSDSGGRLAAGQTSAAKDEPLDTERVAAEADPWFGYGWCFSKLMSARAELGELDWLGDPAALVQHSVDQVEDQVVLMAATGGAGEGLVEGHSAADWAVAILSSEAFMWLMAGANHPTAHLESLREAFERYQACGGPVWGRGEKIDRA